MVARRGKREVRVILNIETAKLLRGLGGVTGRSISSLMQQAAEEFLSKEENQALIEHHKLDTPIDEESDSV